MESDEEASTSLSRQPLYQSGSPASYRIPSSLSQPPQVASSFNIVSTSSAMTMVIPEFSRHRRKTSLLPILVSLLLFLPSLEAVLCHNCRMDGVNRTCEEPCKGDSCAVWRYAKRGSNQSSQGCISNLPNVRNGCRTNQVGATLCICQEDMCNTLMLKVGTVPEAKEIKLSYVQCLASTHQTITNESNPLRIAVGAKRTCRSNVCEYRRSEGVPEEGQTQAPKSSPNHSISQCSAHPEREFDVNLWDDLFAGLDQNFCYRIRTIKNRADTRCVCSTNDCNTGASTIPKGGVQCYMSPAIGSDKVDPSSLCSGHYCFIRQNASGTFSKGCISVSADAAVANSLAYGNRSILGENQWLCRSQYCNLDFSRMEKSNNPRMPGAFFSTASPILSLTAFIITVFVL